MSGRFSAEDIELLSRMPVVTAQIVMVVDTNGVMAAVKELAGMSRSIERGIVDYPNNALIRRVHAALHTAEPRKKSKDNERVELLDEALELFLIEIDKLVQLVGELAPGDEGREYRQWLYSIAEGTAEASKEGSFLGLGGTRVSEPEAAFLTNLATRLGIERLTS